MRALYLSFFVSLIIAIVTVSVHVSIKYKLSLAQLSPFLGIVFPIAFFLNCILLLCFLFYDRRLSVIPLITLIVCVMQVPEHLSFGRWINVQQADKENTNFKLISFNAGKYFTYKKNDGKKVRIENVQILVDIIHKHQPDILFLQEDTRRPRETQYVIKYTNLTNICKFQTGSLTILSRYTLHDCNFESFGNTVNGYIRAKTTISGIEIGLINVHLTSNNIVLTNKKSFSMKATSSLKDYITYFTKTIKDIHNSATIRAKEAEQIKKLSEKMGSRIVVAGDFNDLPLSWSYKILTTPLLDTFIHSGAGWGATFKHLGKLLRLDYILISHDTLSADYFEIIKSGASDHYPILARIGLNGSTN